MENSKIKVIKEKYYEWDGYCPESYLDGEKVRMRLNQSDFFESEKTGLQIGLMFSGVQAVILNKRGQGVFRQTENYADEVFNYEILTKQTMEEFPYCGTDLIQEIEVLENYIKTIK